MEKTFFLIEPLLYGFKLFKVLILNLFPLKHFGESNFYVLNCHGGRTCACSMTKLSIAARDLYAFNLSGDAKSIHLHALRLESYLRSARFECFQPCFRANKAAWLVSPLLSRQRARSLRYPSQGPDRLHQRHCLRHVKCNSYPLPRGNY